MDIITQRFIAISNKLFAELRSVRGGIEKLVSAIHDSKEAQHQQEQQQPPIVRAELQIPEAIERERGEHSKRQYRLQQWLTVGTWLAFGAAAIYASVAIFQWREMIAATGAAQQAVQESRLNRQQSEKSLDATIEQFRLDQRAWLGVDNVIGQPKVGEIFVVTVYIKNTGKTPAKNVRLLSDTEPVTKGARPTFTYKRPDTEGSRSVIAPNSIHKITSLHPTTAIDDPTFDRLKRGDISLYMYGKGIYTDVFGCSHWMNYCFYLMTDAKNWADCSEYNDTGDYQCSPKKTAP